VGLPVPEYVHGDECLFCHRFNIGPGWQKNPHGATVRQVEDAPELKALLDAQPALAAIAPQIDYFLGSRGHVRFLHKEGYGQFALLTTRAALNPDGKVWSWANLDKPAWEKDRFADGCAGCHSTAVDPETRQFTAFGLDCYVCHGVVSLEHTKDPSVIWLSKKHQNDASAVTSICAQCHLRGGRSKSTGLPYANNFVAGDNLFPDYRIDFAKADNPALNPGDRHVLQNVRDVVLNGGATTCLSCHRVHQQSTAKHRLVLSGPICVDCHNANGPKKAVKPYTVHSETCEY
jgi:predicted CXXCH cytochrome family protein